MFQEAKHLPFLTLANIGTWSLTDLGVTESHRNMVIKAVKGDVNTFDTLRDGQQ